MAVCLIFPLAWADESRPQPSWLEDSYFNDYMLPVSETQAWVGSYVQSFGEEIDDFLGDDSQSSIQKGNRVVLYTPFIWDEGDLSQNIHIKAEIELPKTNHRWKLIFDNWREELTQSPTETGVRDSRQSPLESESENQLGARYLLDYSENSFSHIESGLKFRDIIDPNPYINYLQRYKYELAQRLLSRSTSQLYLERYRGFSWQTEQIFDYHYNPETLWRSQSGLSYWHDNREWFFNQAFLWLEQTSSNTAAAYYIDTQWWLHDRDEALQTVSFGANWRSRLYQDWLFGEIEPQIYFDRIDNFNQPNYRIRLQLEMHFYDPR
ncbi:hypothetical protein [Thiomicrorhabdus sediminis]|uniref:Uncharacterized protein n=1 Tax=Thiomicrorhabdus sediminis TaxID=2580412 RepID=A0A4P9K990_9GAMM|nr:hypothetical protein [Thiomicrorhabdus sediminis]QCU91030.1 hypothetical protein FE785_10565 [Thiomicrorhabdus sediminis]